MRLRGRGSVEQELRQLEERETQLAAEEDRLGAAVEAARQAVTEARELEAVAVLDNADPASARQRRLDAENALTATVGDLDVLRRTIAACDQRIEAKRDDVKAAQLAGATEELQRALDEKVNASRTFAAALEQAVSAERALVATRENVKALRAKVAELGGDWREQQVDEAEWPDTGALVEFLTTSRPQRPVAEEQRSARQRELDAENAKRHERQLWVDRARAFGSTLPGRPEELEERREEFLAAVPAEYRDEAERVEARTRSELRASSGRRAGALERL